MKQKKFFFLAAAAMFMAACSENDVIEKQSPQEAANPGAVMFDVYTQRAVTRAGVTGALTTVLLQDDTKDFGKAGFGVFGYYTNSSTYDQQALPNFFYNQQVKYDGGYFKYEPVKYWPNEYGTTAESEDADKVSFFAYAPYIEVVPATGKPTEAGNTPEQNAELQKWGINSLTRNNATGDPMVKYIASFDQDKSVDLLWGVCDDTDWRIVQTGGIQGDLKAGKPWLDVQRPADPSPLTGSSGQKVKFTFKHATAQLKVMIDAYVDGTGNGIAITPKTKVYVRSISFEGLATKGALNLNNSEAGANTAYWLDFNGTNDLVTGEAVTIYDGRKDGKEGTPSGIATNEKMLGLNPNLVQSTMWGALGEKPGVTNESQNLLRKWNETTGEYEAADAPIYVIPTGDPVKVTITYDIETEDNNLATYVSDLDKHGSSIENVITKEINFGGTKTLKNGNSYVINLHLGMNSVKFDASIKEWEVPVASDVDLPSNLPTASVAAGESKSITLPYSGGKGVFQVTGLAEGTTISAAAANLPTGTTATPRTAAVGSDGMAIVDYEIKPNETVSDITNGTITVNGTTLNITLKAAPLGLSVSAVAPSGLSITLGATATNLGTELENATIIRNRGGVSEAVTPSSTTSGVITLTAADEVKAGDIYTITVNPGDGKSPSETTTAMIGGIAFASDAYTIEYGQTGFKAPLIVYGSAPTSPTYESVTEATATIDGTGEVTTVKAGTSTINLSVTQSGGGYFYTTNSQKATYNLTVDKANATIAWGTLADFTDQPITANGTIGAINKAKLYNSLSNELTQDADHGGTIAYSIVSIDGSTTSDLFKIDGNNLKVGTNALTNSKTYTIQLRATVTAGASARYDNTVADKTITVTTVAP